MSVQVISSNKSATPVGAYSQAVVANGFVFVSGLPPLDPATGQVVSDDVAEQTHRCMQSLQGILEDAGCSLNDLVKVVLYLTDMETFSTANAVYQSYFPSGYLPARTTPQIGRLPKPGAKVGVDAIAVLPNPQR
ncbi:MAG: Rid family detoxifying hydrolase [Alicyclobacillus sp.]|nr:Rid family detoxifying hydrolase [Alicyclobacillus sp.]